MWVTFNVYIITIFNTYFNKVQDSTRLLEIPEDKVRKYTYQIFHDIWKRDLENSRKGECYNSFKQTMKFEPYLEKLKRKHRVILTKLRVSDHKLMIEQGRRTTPRIAPEQRTCMICPTKIEDEKHFIVECPLYGSRNSLFDIVTETFPNFETLNNQQKFSFLMTQEDKNITNKLVEELEKWLSLRNVISTYFLQP